MRRDGMTAEVVEILQGAEARADAVKDTASLSLAGTGPRWPGPLAPEAFHGIAGEIVNMIAPHSEADEVALLAHFLVAFGNVVGRSAHFVKGGTRHYPNLSAVFVGSTASGKGSAKDDTFFVIRQVDPDWFEAQIQSGLSSGEGLIWAVRDPIEEQQAIKEKGRVVDYQMVVTDPGVKDKRLLLVETEFGSVLRVLERDGNTLSALIRQAWDSGCIRILTKNKAARATNAHISIIGHVTHQELLKYLQNTELWNGFANRKLWFAVRRSKFLPDGGELNLLDLGTVTERLRKATAFAQQGGEMRRSEAAKAIWHAVYRALAGDRGGLLGAVTNRAAPQTMRLAMIYALLDRSSVIEVEHLNAALALWSYSEVSARYIFGDALGEPTADQIEKWLQANPGGLTRTGLSDLFKRNKSAAEIDSALTVLVEHGRVRREMEETTGRPAERWFALRTRAKETNLTKEVGVAGQ